ncbi:hypothetical protein HU200_005159 [Digitaria exilis]|uniref:Uncharacterized protein n=1 Tax=Digitaria exilis TaxID=1010633 RepID=A0A835KWR5_9POAL|nr:hypothetical protein HU200_005159 [Digitaria exilis]
MELQVVITAGHRSDNYHVVDVKARPTGGGQDHHHVVDVDQLLVVNVVAGGDAGTSTSTRGHHAVNVAKPKDNDGGDGAGKNRCVTCKEPMSLFECKRGEGFVVTSDSVRAEHIAPFIVRFLLLVCAQVRKRSF